MPHATPYSYIDAPALTVPFDFFFVNLLSTTIAVFEVSNLDGIDTIFFFNPGRKCGHNNIQNTRGTHV